MLKIKNGFNLRNAGNTYLILSSLPENTQSPKMFAVNESGAILWNELLKGADKAGLLLALQKEYETDSVEIMGDIEEFLINLQDMGVLYEE